MKVRLLGTAAGGGYPQWNCACAQCRSCTTPRDQDCLAVSADGARWYLVNASPDLRAQLLATPALAPGPGPRETPVRGVLLTDAELDHTLGLVLLRGAADLRVLAPPAVLHALRDGFPVRETVDRYAAWDWLPLTGTAEVDGLEVTAFPVSDKRPKYAAESTVDGPWVVALRIADPATGGVLVYAPCLRAWPDGFDQLCADAGLVLLDGTFHAAGEMSGVGGAPQRAMGHLPMTGEDGSLAHIRAHPHVRWAYTHLNNTNPVLDPASPAHAEITAAGVALPEDGTEYTL